MICCDFYDDLEGTYTRSYKVFLFAPFQVQKNALHQSCQQGNFHLQFGSICCAISCIIKLFGTIRRLLNFSGSSEISLGLDLLHL